MGDEEDEDGMFALFACRGSRWWELVRSLCREIGLPVVAARADTSWSSPARKGLPSAKSSATTSPTTSACRLLDRLQRFLTSLLSVPSMASSSNTAANSFGSSASNGSWLIAFVLSSPSFLLRVPVSSYEAKTKQTVPKRRRKSENWGY